MAQSTPKKLLYEEDEEEEEKFTQGRELDSQRPERNFALPSPYKPEKQSMKAMKSHLDSVRYQRLVYQFDRIQDTKAKMDYFWNTDHK